MTLKIWAWGGLSFKNDSRYWWSITIWRGEILMVLFPLYLPPQYQFIIIWAVVLYIWVRQLKNIIESCVITVWVFSAVNTGYKGFLRSCSSLSLSYLHHYGYITKTYNYSASLLFIVFSRPSGIPSPGSIALAGSFTWGNTSFKRVRMMLKPSPYNRTGN